MKPYSRPSANASLEDLRAAEDQLEGDIRNGDRRGVDCSEELNRLAWLIASAEEKRDRPNRLERALARRSPETPLPEGI